MYRKSVLVLAVLAAFILVGTAQATYRVGDTAAGWGYEWGLGDGNRLGVGIGFEGASLTPRKIAAVDAENNVTTWHDLNRTSSGIGGGVRYYLKGQDQTGLFVDGSVGIHAVRGSTVLSDHGRNIRLSTFDGGRLHVGAGLGYNWKVTDNLSLSPQLEVANTRTLVSAGVGLAWTF